MVFSGMVFGGIGDLCLKGTYILSNLCLRREEKVGYRKILGVVGDDNTLGTQIGRQEAIPINTHPSTLQVR